MGKLKQDGVVQDIDHRETDLTQWTPLDAGPQDYIPKGKSEAPCDHKRSK